MSHLSIIRRSWASCLLSAVALADSRSPSSCVPSFILGPSFPMSRRSANLSRFAGTSQSPHPSPGGYGYSDTDDAASTSAKPPDIDDGSYPLRPLSRNRTSGTIRADSSLDTESSGGSYHRSLLRANDKAVRKANDRRKSRLSDAEQEHDGYTHSGAEDEQAEQDRLLLSSAGLDGSWAFEGPRPLDTVDELREPRFSVSSHESSRLPDLMGNS